jgi:arylformamidase
MKASIELFNRVYHFDLGSGHDITLTLDHTSSTPKCFYAPNLRIEAVKTDHFIGDISQGGIVNFKNVMINPHGNGTHTECVGHIIDGSYYISDALQKHHWISQLISVRPTILENGDSCILLSDIKKAWTRSEHVDALIIRTLPNNLEKQHLDYSGANPTYVDEAAMQHINDSGVLHLLIDLPSVDREEDGAKFAAHKAFWSNGLGDYNSKKTITELVFIDNKIEDGLFLCGIFPLRLIMDASPSRVVIYALE